MAAAEGKAKVVNHQVIPRKFLRKERGPLLPRIKWAMLIYIGIVHVLGMYGLILVLSGEPSSTHLLWHFCTYAMSGLGITAGAHRLWAHKSYKASPVMKAILLVFNSMANQGTIFHWARNHRVHHKFSECNADPHNAKRGFFFAHMGWLMIEKDPDVIRAGKMLDVSDLKNDPFVKIQERYNPVWNLVFCFVLPAIVPVVAWGDSFMINFWLACARYLLVLHATWAVNSFAHFYGGTPYAEDSNPAENPVVSLFAMGEGWHCYHHMYPFDYAASELGVLGQFNPTKLFIDACAWFGIVSDRRRSLSLWKKREAAILDQKEDHESVVQGPPLFKQRYIRRSEMNLLEH